MNLLHYSEILLTGSQNATADQFRRTAQLMPALGGLDSLTTHRFDMTNADGAYTVREGSRRPEDDRLSRRRSGMSPRFVWPRTACAR